MVACFAWWSLPASVKKFKSLKEDERELLLAVLDVTSRITAQSRRCCSNPQE